MSNREELERGDESIERFDVETASDEELAQKIRDASDDLFFLLEVAKARDLLVTGCHVEGKGTMALGHQYPVAIQTEVKVIRAEVI